MKKDSIFLLLVLAFLTSECGLLISPGCGLFGATSTYDDEFVIDEPFEPIKIAKGETFILRPATHVHINYTYTGSSNCDGEDYKDGPSYVHPTFKNDSIATAEEFYDYDSEPLWRGSEMKVRIKGKEVGQTVLLLEIEWSVETRDYYLDKSKNFEVELTVTEP